MIGKVVSLEHKKYNVIILAGGAGSRMGIASDFIPKALTKLGESRAIDFIIERYSHVAHKFIIGTAFHSDLLISYISGRHKKPIQFSIENPENLINNCYSTVYCLDNADSRFGTIITFCDLLMMDNLTIEDDSIYYVSDSTKGNPGSFRHSVFFKNNSPAVIKNNKIPKLRSNGLLGNFVISDTPLLKSILYSKYSNLFDLTDDGIIPYMSQQIVTAHECASVFEFGNETDLIKVRDLWKNV
jgi:hypothetical protein